MVGRLKLAKVPLCLLIGCSTLFGAILARPVITWSALVIAGGVFVLAMGGATLNSLQEYRQDGLMQRTRNRPLVQKTVSLTAAAWQAVLLLVSGLLIILSASGSYYPTAAALLAIVIYNGVYTPLKKTSVLSIIPGAVCGALPPYIGWLGAQGSLYAYQAMLLISLFVLWQVPHFWLVMLTFQQDYLQSNQPNLLKQLQENSIKRFFVTWIGALVSVMIMFVILPLDLRGLFSAAVIVNGGALLGVFVHGLAGSAASNYRRLFIVLNVSLLLHMVIITVGRLTGQ